MKNRKVNLILGILLAIFGEAIMPARNGVRWYVGFVAFLFAGAALAQAYAKKK